MRKLMVVAFVPEDTVQICLTQEEAFILSKILQKVDNQALQSVRKKIEIAILAKNSCG